jgi:hypothetical protein
MADDVVMPLNPLVVLVEKKLLDVNVSQRLSDKELFERVVHTQIDRSAWDHGLFPNPHVLVIYLKFVPARGVAPKRFEECQCEDDDVCLHCQTWVLGIIVSYEAQSTPFPCNIKPNT